MRPLSASELLRAWEQGQVEKSFRRALSLLAAANPETLPQQLAELSVGQRDANLLTLHELTFGSRLEGLTNCPACNERLEMKFEVDDIRVDSEITAPETLSVSKYEYKVEFRLPNTMDLDSVANCKDTTAIHRRILQRCIITANHKGKEVAVEKLPRKVMNAIIDRMNKADPQANVQISLTCPQCGHHWLVIFDIVSYFWKEVDAWASRILQEVHVLACAYNWREADILAMSPMRRQIYLEMLNR